MPRQRGGEQHKARKGARTGGGRRIRGTDMTTREAASGPRVSLPERTREWARLAMAVAVLATIQRLPSWQRYGYAYPCSRWFQTTLRICRKTVGNILRLLRARGEIVTTLVRQGELLPHGGRARWSCLLIRPGPAMLARLAPPVPRRRSAPVLRARVRRRSARRRGGVRNEVSPPCAMSAHHYLISDLRSGREEFFSAPAATPPVTPPEVALPETQATVSGADWGEAAEADPVTALLREHAQTTGLPRRNDPAARALVAEALADMDGAPAARVARVRQVIQAAVAQSKKGAPTLRYVFDLPWFRVRLQRIASPERPLPMPDVLGMLRKCAAPDVDDDDPVAVRALLRASLQEASRLAG